jgi:hypothetical protein
MIDGISVIKRGGSSDSGKFIAKSKIYGRIAGAPDGLSHISFAG